MLAVDNHSGHAPVATISIMIGSRMVGISISQFTAHIKVRQKKENAVNQHSDDASDTAHDQWSQEEGAHDYSPGHFDCVPGKWHPGKSHDEDGEECHTDGHASPEWSQSDAKEKVLTYNGPPNADIFEEHSCQMNMQK